MAIPKMNQCATLVEVLSELKNYDDRGIVFIKSRQNEDQFVSYKKLWQRAVTILFNLQQKGIRPGNELLFQVSDNYDFIAVFWSCLLGGFIPVPVTVAKNDSYRFKLFKVWKTLSDPYLVTSNNLGLDLKEFAVQNHLIDVFNQMEAKKLLIEELESSQGIGNIRFPDKREIAFIQFSSGSTSDPKGVVLTHGNLMTNTKDIAIATKATTNGERFLSWMPLTHDMGLIGMHLYPTVMGWQHFLMPPELFVRHPLFWLEKISEYRATVIASPNFGYKHLLKFYSSAKIKNIDLSSVRLIVNGAEPISADLCHRFMKALEPLGLKKTAMFPSYGLAEACVGVAFSEPDQAVVQVTVDRNCLNIGDKIREIDGKSRKAAAFVGVGKPLKHCRLRIVNDDDIEVEDEVVGHIQIQGANVTSGYYNHPQATREAITADGWLRTGDLGFIHDGQLVIIGRAKDIIFVNGLNFYAHDIEFICDRLDGVDSKEIAVCGVRNSRTHLDEVLCFVVFRRSLTEFLPLMERLKKHIVQQTGIGITQLIPVKNIPVTTSGKKQRYQLGEAYQQGQFDSVIRELAALQSEIAG